MQEDTDYQSLSSQLKVIHFALMASILIYGFLIYTVKADWPEVPVSDDDQLRLFSVLGLGACFVGMLINRSFLKKERLRNHSSPKAGIMMGFIMSWALFESCSIFGFIYSFTNKDASQFHLFAILSLLSMLAHPPSKARIKNLLN